LYDFYATVVLNLFQLSCVFRWRMVGTSAFTFATTETITFRLLL